MIYSKTNRRSVQKTTFIQWINRCRPITLALTFAILLLNFSMVAAQTKTITGTIIDEDGLSIPGANVVIKGTSIGTVSNIDGQYTLTAVVTPDDVLQISFIGFVTQEIVIGTQTQINVKLQSDAMNMDEVVVVGYGVQKKSLVTGAISSIQATQLESSSVSRVEEAMQGRTAGVFVLPESGSPGAGMKVRIRGAGSNGNSNPLYIVDGVRMSDVNDISPDDIASVELLKDGASSAIYGAEGGNGVIIISTKSGGNKEGQVTYNMKYGIQSPGKMPSLMNGMQYAQYQNEAGYISADNLPLATNMMGTDWLGEMFSSAPIQNHNLSFSGGSDKTSYFASVSYFDQQGILGEDKSSFNRLSTRLNVSHKVKDWLKVSTNITYARTNRSALNEDDEFGGLISTGMLIDPLTPSTYADGSEPQHVKSLIADGQNVRRDANGRVFGISKYVQGEMVNPFIQMDIAEGKTLTDKLIGSFSLEISPMKGLTIISRPGIDLAFENYHSWTPTYYYSVERNNNILSVNDDWKRYSQWQWENFATYTKDFEQSSLNVVVGMSAQESKERYLESSSAAMTKPGSIFAEHDYTGSDQDKVIGNEYTDRLLSYFGRASYDYKNKYMVQATLRRDLTSTVNVPLEGIAGIFPSFSAGWNVSEEDFFPDMAINWLKVRASWVQNGSIQGIKSVGRYQYIATITTEGLRYPTSNGTYITVAEPGVLPNPDLTWETSEQTNFGVDLGAWNNQLTFSLDYYVKNTKDLLLQGQPPKTAGNKAPIINAGDVKNSGLELMVGYQNRKNQVKWGVNANISTLKNEVTLLNSPTPRINGASIGTGSWVGATAFEVGQPLWYFRGFETNGVDKVTGDPNFVDQNKDGEITDEDRVYLGDPHPDIMYGATLFADYKGFDVNVFLQGQAGNQIVYGWMRTDRLTSNRLSEFYEDRWTATNTSGSMPKANADSRMYASDLMVHDGDYLRVKQIQFGYNFPQSLLQNVHLSKARLYVSLDDYLTFTKYKGMDPLAGSSKDESLGIDRGVYPTPRKFMFGLSVTF